MTNCDISTNLFEGMLRSRNVSTSAPFSLSSWGIVLLGQHDVVITCLGFFVKLVSEPGSIPLTVVPLNKLEWKINAVVLPGYS